MTAPARVPVPPSPLRAVAGFLLSGAVVLAAVGVMFAFVQHRSAVREAVRDASTLTQVLASDVVEPRLTDAALRPGLEQAALDAVVRARVLDAQIVQVKVWDADSVVVYSDDPALIGRRFSLSAAELAALGRGSKPFAEVSELDDAENADQQEFGRLMQVYQGVETAEGTPLLFEAYHRYDTIAAASHTRTVAFLRVLVAGLVLLWLAQAPLAWRLASRLRAAQDEREQLLVAALAASDRERQRIAADLHDGVVQGLTGTSYTLTAEAARLSLSGQQQSGALLHRLAVDLRRSVREVRSLMVTITPPGLRRQPLVASLKDLVAPLEDRAIDVRVDVPVGADLDLDQAVVDLVLRTAQEAVRNILRHAAARSVTVELSADVDRVGLVVTDDGAGFTREASQSRRDSMGLDLLAGLAHQLGGRIEVRSTPGAGTRLELLAPRRVPEPVPA